MIVAIILLTIAIIVLAFLNRKRPDTDRPLITAIIVALGIILLNLSSKAIKPDSGPFSNQWAFYGLFLGFFFIIGLVNRKVKNPAS